MKYENLKSSDLEIYNLILEEENRQKMGLELIPSENYVSESVLEAMGSILTNKYSEGYAGKRYYGGNEFIDKIEEIAIERAKKLFGVPYVNVQPLSGSPANQAVCFAILNPGDTLMGLNIHDGGHLTHGANLSFSSTYYKSVPYFVDVNGKVDFVKFRELLKENKPKLVWIGGSAYTKQFEFEEIAKIVEDESDAYVAADIAHVAGLVVSGLHPSPANYVHIITTTTHKTLRGPRGAMIMVTEKGLKKDSNLGSKVDKAIIPGLQGGPHNHTTAGIAVALREAATFGFKEYSKQIIENAKILSQTLMENDIHLVGNGTENHLMLIDLTLTSGIGSGIFAEYALGLANITVNKNLIPKDPSNPFYPSGFRCGTPAITTRGMKENEMKLIGKWISEVIKEIGFVTLPTDKEERLKFIKDTKNKLTESTVIKGIKDKVQEICKNFPTNPQID